MEDQALICPICGEPTSVWYGNARKDKLCREHAAQLKEGLIETDGHGNFINVKTKKIINKTFTEKQDEPVKESKNATDELTCIICSEPSNGKHFCINCYKEFANKVLYIQVKKCKEFTKLESEYESDFVCEDGHLVKSPYEKIIDNWLYQENIKHAYERKIDIDETHDITPDFFIPEYEGTKNIYVEFWGYGEENVKYQRIKQYKLELYPKLIKKTNMAVVYLNKKDVETDNFKKKLKYAKQGEIKE